MVFSFPFQVLLDYISELIRLLFIIDDYKCRWSENYGTLISGLNLWWKNFLQNTPVCLLIFFFANESQNEDMRIGKAKYLTEGFAKIH